MRCEYTGERRPAADIGVWRRPRAAAAVHLAALLSHDVATGPTLTDFRTATMAAAIMAAVSTLDALPLWPDAGSLVSGRRRWENDGLTQTLSEIAAAPSIAARASPASE